MRAFLRYGVLFLIGLFCNRAFGQSTEIKYLSGTGNDHTVSWQFYCTGGMNAGQWTTIPVPSCWELQGFGKYDYGFAKDSIRGKEKGLYKYSFSVPAAWKNKVINLCFEGVMTDAAVKVNGRPAGAIHQGAFYAFKYDVSSLLKYDAANLLEVTVAKHSANPSVNEAERRADFWIFGGIFRPVFLEALPQEHIAQVAVDAKANGKLTTEVSTKGGDRLSLQLFNANGKALGKKVSTAVSSNKALLTSTFFSPKLWSPEFPNLYKAVFTLYKKGKPVHTVSKKIGFRTVEVKQRDGFYVNGVKVKMKGVNRHSFWPTSGRTISKALSIEDVQLMKDMNMNAVRMSHYPPDDHFLDVCDSLGLFVMDELAGWHGHYDTPTGTKLLKEMIAHDGNHPSIVIWSNGNEGGHNRELDTLFTTDDLQKRPVVHPWELFGGFDTQHYREYNYGIGNYEAGHAIVMPTEFLHGQFDGGHGAGLEDYWEKMWQNPLSAGGFLWDFADEGVVRKDKHDSIDTDKFRGADGIVGPFHEKEGSYYAIKEIWSPVYFEKREITPAFDGSFTVENRYHFTNLSQCRFEWQLKKLQDLSAHNSKGVIPSPNIKPLQKGVLKVVLPKTWREYDVLHVSAFGPDGRLIYKWSFPLTKPAEIAAAVLKTKAAGKVSIAEQDSVYFITVNGISIRLNKRTGTLLEARNEQGAFPLTNGPVVQEGANNFAGFTHRYDGDTLLVESAFDRKKSYNTLQWKIYPSGLIKTQVRYFPSEYFTWFDGVNFSFPEKEIKAVEYMGSGPYRVWKNRMKGTTFGVWKKEYNNTETGESWNYPEFKGYHSKIYWCKFITTSQPFTVYTENEDLFLRLFTPAYKTDQWHNYEPLFPSGDISFMQGIPSIGSKTQRAETTGPMGMKNIFYDYEKEPSRALQLTLYFDFRTEKAKQP
ncbi:glycoside hydrolase family 2 protein [Flavisolibacter nicotianae]|uniref:glycoside hydrolase family 2 protein n=1 Tax=Flavisolibacter nicotianae TaxID=2364882 RepID=UPI000EABF80C|nr:glycoside hydrolase family 2 TIM barrel-domain containing protein [Flavisolibacter nicotianae]